MSDKERLADIKNRFVKYEYDYNLNGEDVEWLIEQAERVQELEEVLLQKTIFMEYLAKHWRVKNDG